MQLVAICQESRPKSKDTRLDDIVRYSLVDGIATLTLDDGKVNAMTPTMSAALNDGLDQAAREAAVVVIRGRENVFCGGFDLTIMRGDDDALKGRMLEDGRALLKRLYLFPQPVIFAVTGHAIAMGALMILAGDIRVGLTGDFRIGLNETRIGLALPISGIEIARDRLAPTVFQRATVNAELFSPDDAVSAGFLDQAVGPADFDGAVAMVAKALASLDPVAFGETKRRVRQSAFERVAISTG